MTVTETILYSRQKWSKIFKILRERKCEPKISYLANDFQIEKQQASCHQHAKTEGMDTAP